MAHDERLIAQLTELLRRIERDGTAPRDARSADPDVAAAVLAALLDVEAPHRGPSARKPPAG